MTTTVNTHTTRAKLLAGLVQRHLKILTMLQMDTELKEIQPLVQSILSDRFKVLVIGEFNRGKSTFINALLGEKVLPTYPIETTAIINEVKWGEQKSAKLYQQGKVVRTLEEATLAELEQYVIAKKNVENPYEKVELFWPLELCRSGVEIIDSPGLNVVSDTRRAQTLDYLPSADAIIMVADANVAGSASEVLLVKQLKDLGHSHIFFVCNKINMIELDERNLVQNAFIEDFAPYTEPGAKYIFFLNAKGALQGRIRSDMRAVHESGITQIEDALKDFLVHERGRIKLLRPAQALKASIEKATVAIEDRESALKKTFADLQKGARQAEKQLERIDFERQAIIADFDIFSRDISRLTKQTAQEFYQAQVENVLTWANTYEIPESEQLTVWEITTNNKEAKERVITTIQNGISEQMRLAFIEWEEQTLQPRIAERLKGYSIRLEQQVRKFVEDFEQIRQDVFGAGQQPSDLSNTHVDAILRQILARATGYNGDVSNIDKEFGFGRMFKLLLPHGGVLGALTLLFGWHPFIFIPVVAVAVLINMGGFREKVHEKMKEEVGKRYQQYISLSSRDLADQTATATEEQFIVFRDNLDQALGQQIQGFREQLQASLNDVQHGDVERRLLELREAQLSLLAIKGELDGMLGQLVLMRSTVS